MPKDKKPETGFGVSKENSETLENLSNRIRECAKLAGSGDKLSQLSAIPRRTLEMYLAGESEPKALRVAAIAKAVGVSGHWLLTGEGEMRPGGSSGTESSLEDEFAMVPGYSIQVAAGDGALPGSEPITRKLAFRRKWLRFRGLNEKDLALVFAKGDSMEPTIDDNNTVMIDTNQKELRDGSIYVIRTNDHLIVKRIQTRLGKQVLLISDNKAYPPIEVSMDEASDLEVIGRVVWIGKDV